MKRQTSSSASEVRQAQLVAPVFSVELRPDLVDCHPLVRTTERFFTKTALKIEQTKKEVARRRRIGEWHPGGIPAKTLNDRLVPTDPGCLRIVATLKSIDWILRFHDALIRALALHGCTVQARRWNTSDVAEVDGSGEYVALSFAEEFETRVPAKPRWSGDKEFIAKDTYKLKLDRSYGSGKVWTGNQPHLEKLLPKIARDIAACLASRAEERLLADAEEAERKAEAERRADAQKVLLAAEKLVRDRKVVREAQLDRAKAAARAHDEFLALESLVSVIEERMTTGDIAVGEWLAAVRDGMTDPIDRLIQEVRDEAAHADKPLWWPDDESMANASVEPR